MILIIGGAFQGKVDFAKEKFGVIDKNIFNEFHLKIKQCIADGKDRNEYK